MLSHEAVLPAPRPSILALALAPALVFTTTKKHPVQQRGWQTRFHPKASGGRCSHLLRPTHSRALVHTIKKEILQKSVWFPILFLFCFWWARGRRGLGAGRRRNSAKVPALRCPSSPAFFLEGYWSLESALKGDHNRQRVERQRFCRSL